MDEKVREVIGMIRDAIAKRGTLEFCYVFERGHVVSIRDLAEIESAITEGVGGFVRRLGELAGLPDDALPPKDWLRLEVASMKRIEDGENTVVVLIDFEKILPKG